MAKLLKLHDLDSQADSIADYLPGGKLFAAKKIEGKKLRNLLRGLSYILKDAEEAIELAAEEYDIRTTTLFIEEWEGFVGIPDDCFTVSADIGQRRKNVLTKLTSLGAQTKEDFIALALAFGIVVDVDSGFDLMVFPFTFPWIFFSTESEARFTIVLTFYVSAEYQFPYTFPLKFSPDAVSVLTCLFQHIKPANVQLIFRQV